MCRERLAPNGIAFISYNVYPGRHVRQMLREMTLYHTRNIPDLTERIRQARWFLQFLREGRAVSSPWQALLDDEIEALLERDDDSLCHDDLAESNDPVYFRDFAAHAERHGLQYLGEADLYEMFDPPGRLAWLEGDVIEREQYLDFLRVRRFRQTLLCRPEIVLDRQPGPALMERFLFSAPAQIIDGGKIQGLRGIRITAVHEAVNRVAAALGETYPLPLAFDELVPYAGDRDALREILFGLVVGGFADIHVYDFPCEETVTERPRASRLARHQAALSAYVTGACQHVVKLDEVARHLVCLMDGTRDRHQLAEDLAAIPGAPAAGEIGEHLLASLEWLARMSLARRLTGRDTIDAMKIACCLVLGAIFGPPAALAASCESLAALALPDSRITLAQAVPAGELTLPGATDAAARLYKSLPAFCRVAATLEPTSDSDIKIEVWLPASGWNGKFQAVGNGGWAGSISYPAMGQALLRGYATASTDTGHTGGSASFALGHREKLIDFGYRAVHEMTVKSKLVVSAFYGDPARLSYWNGCSTGGRQALKEAQQYPSDYDGIIAGAPANFRTHLQIGQIWTASATLKDPASYIPPGKYPLIHKAVLDACDSLDGVKDGLLENPLRCHFDPAAIQCKGADTSSCLTAPQVEAARKIYAGATNPRTGLRIWPGLMPGERTGLGADRRRPGTHRPGHGVFPVRGIRGCQLGLEDVQLRYRYGTHREARIRDERHRPEPRKIRRARREAAALSRMERPVDHAPEQHQLLQERGGHHGRAGEDRGVRAPVPGAGDGALRRRRRAQQLRHGGSPRAVGGKVQGAGANHCVSPRRRHCGPDPAAVSLPAGRGLERIGQYRLGLQLCMRRRQSLARWSSLDRLEPEAVKKSKMAADERR